MSKKLSEKIDEQVVDRNTETTTEEKWKNLKEILIKEMKGTVGFQTGTDPGNCG